MIGVLDHVLPRSIPGVIPRRKSCRPPPQANLFSFAHCNLKSDDENELHGNRTAVPHSALKVIAGEADRGGKRTKRREDDGHGDSGSKDDGNNKHGWDNGVVTLCGAYQPVSIPLHENLSHSFYTLDSMRFKMKRIKYFRDN